MRLRKTLGTMFGVLGALLIIIMVWLFLVFPRVVNQLADLLGQMGTGDNVFMVDLTLGAIHFAIAFVISIIIAYFFIWRPTRRLREVLDAPGLIIRKGEGMGFVDTESVRQQIFAAISKFTDIKRAEVNVENDAGRALIRMSIVTDILMNGPQKKNEINREVRKIVQDQMGIDIQGKPTISFSLSPLVPETPLITSGSASKTVETTPYESPVIESRPRTSPMPPPEDEPDVEPETDEDGEPHEYRPSGPTGIDLARTDPFAKTRSESTLQSTLEPTPQPIVGEDDPTYVGGTPTTPTPSPSASTSTSTSTDGTDSTSDDSDSLAAQG